MAVFLSVPQTQREGRGPAPSSRQKKNRIDELTEQWLAEQLGKKVVVRNVCKMCKYVNIKKMSHRSHPLREKGLGTNCVKTPPTHSLRPRVGSLVAKTTQKILLILHSKSTKIQKHFYELQFTGGQKDHEVNQVSFMAQSRRLINGKQNLV